MNDLVSDGQEWRRYTYRIGCARWGDVYGGDENIVKIHDTWYYYRNKSVSILLVKNYLE